jgi:co-chaperonin GroES (HSP10)
MIKALADKVVVQEMKKEKSKGGLIIPDSVQQPQAFGVVLSVGEAVKSSIKVGDLLVFHVSGGMTMVIEGKILRCLMEQELYGLVDSVEIEDTLTPCEVKQLDLDTLDAEIKKQQPAHGAGGSRIIKV